MARKRRKSGPRASWHGQLRIDLVAFPVEAFNAVEPGGGDIHFHQLHATCHKRIHYEKVCPVHGEVSSEEIVSGYEYTKGKYVEVEPEELDKLRTKADKELTIDTFVPADQIDPLYMDGRIYYLSPKGTPAAESYGVVCAAMEKRRCWGIGQVVFSEKEQLVLVRPLNGVLTMSMLRHEKEVRTTQKLGIERSRTASKKIKLAEQLIDAATEDHFDYGDYTDRYQEKLHRLIEMKIHGEEVTVPEEADEEPEVINLLDALKQSVAKAKAAAPKRRKKPARARTRQSKTGGRRKKAS